MLRYAAMGEHITDGPLLAKRKDAVHATGDQLQSSAAGGTTEAFMGNAAPSFPETIRPQLSGVPQHLEAPFVADQHLGSPSMPTPAAGSGLLDNRPAQAIGTPAPEDALSSPQKTGKLSSAEVTFLAPDGHSAHHTAPLSCMPMASLSCMPMLT